MRHSAERSKLPKEANAMLSTEGEHRRNGALEVHWKKPLGDRERLGIIIIIIIIIIIVILIPSAVKIPRVKNKRSG